MEVSSQVCILETAAFSKPADPTLTEKNLWPQLRLLDDWYNLGLQLDIPKDKLREIEDSHPDKTTRCKEETMDYWLKRGRNPSWETLAAAIADMGHLDIAKQIREKYLQVSSHCCITFCWLYNTNACRVIILSFRSQLMITMRIHKHLRAKRAKWVSDHELSTFITSQDVEKKSVVFSTEHQKANYIHELHTPRCSWSLECKKEGLSTT